MRVPEAVHLLPLKAIEVAKELVSLEKLVGLVFQQHRLDEELVLDELFFGKLQFGEVDAPFGRVEGEQLVFLRLQLEVEFVEDRARLLSVLVHLRSRRLYFLEADDFLRGILERSVKI